MHQQEFDQLVGQVEENLYKYDHEYVNEFIGITKDHEAELTPEQRKWLDAEVAAFMPHTTDTTKADNDQPRFRSCEFTDEQLAHYQERVKVCTNPKMAQRYYDLLWEFAKKSNRKEIGDGLVRTSLELATVLDHDNEFERQDSINRAMQISVLIEKGNGQLTDAARQAVRDYLKKQQADGTIRYSLELIDTVISFHKLFDKDDYTYCSELCREAIKHFETENNNFTLKGAFIERKYKLAKLLSPTIIDNKARATELAQVQIDEAHRRTDSVMVQLHFLTAAEKILKDAGVNDKAAELRKEIIALGKSEDYENSFQQFSHQEAIPQEELDRLEKLLTDLGDLPAVIALSPNFTSKWSGAKEQADRAPASLSDMFTTTIIDNNGMTVAVEDDSERTKIMRYFQFGQEFKLTILAGLLNKLRKSGRLTIKDFEPQFNKIKEIDADCYDSVMYGLERFMEGKDYEASLILGTQLENMMYCMLPVMEVDQYIFENNGKTQSPKTMGKFLPEIKEVIGNDLYELLNYSLIDKGKVNLRNDIGHGKTNINSNNLLACVRLIQLYGALLVMVKPEGQV